MTNAAYLADFLLPKAVQRRLWERETLEQLLRRFMSKVAIDGAGCWIWQAGLSSDGYGVISVGDVQVRAHRLAYELFVGPIPDGLVTDHLCRVHACVNPQHLEMVTDRENLMRGVGPTAVNAARTHCDRGHPLEGPNVYRPPREPGTRQCRRCKLIRQNGYRAARTGGLG